MLVAEVWLSDGAMSRARTIAYALPLVPSRDSFGDLPMLRIVVIAGGGPLAGSLPSRRAPE
jgi:hypothetical protein